jgi:hypothetical protein
VRRLRRHHDHLVLARQARDRRDHRQVDRRPVEDDAADHHHAADQQGVRIALGAVDELREADRAGGAALVLELHRLHELVGLQRRGERATRLVPAAARIGGDHHLDRAQLLRERAARTEAGEGERRDGGGIEVTTVHASLP